MLSKQKIKDYVSKGGIICPYCGSQDLTGGDREINGGIVRQVVECDSCKRTWEDLYKLSGVYEYPETR